jgi:hypothetical protein
MTTKFNVAANSTTSITLGKDRRKSLLNLHDDLDFGLTKKDRCRQISFHSFFLLLEMTVAFNNFLAWRYFHNKKVNNDHDDEDLFQT